jgi:HlyD family secretion protein
MKAHPIWTTTTGLVAVIVLACFFWPDNLEPMALANNWPHAAELGPAGNVQLAAPGVTEPRSRTIQLTSEASGTLRAIHVQAGDPVKRGQVLAELENDVQRLSVEIARAAAERLQAELRRLEQGNRPEECAIARAGLDEAEANLHLAEFEAARMAEMNGRQAVSEREIASVQASLALAKAQRDAAAGRWQLSMQGAREEDLNCARAGLREAEAKLKTAEALLEKTFIRSPIDGMVIYRHCEPGEALPAGLTTPILSVGDCSATRVRVDVDEMDVGKVWVGQPVYATAPAFGERRLAGRVVHVEPTLGRKNFRTQRPTERLDTRVQEVVVELSDAQGIPMELQMIVWFLHEARAAR